MLSLTRKEGEIITIGDNITLTVQAINGSQVRIGIEAPREMSIHRLEVVQRLREDAESEG